MKQSNDNLIKFEDCFFKAGYENYVFNFTDNEYWGNNLYSGCWYNVKTEIGNIRIGWRKRVVEIVIDDSIGVDLNEIKKELNHETTSEKNLIHAWRNEDIILYLQKIREKYYINLKK